MSNTVYSDNQLFFFAVARVNKRKYDFSTDSLPPSKRQKIIECSFTIAFKNASVEKSNVNNTIQTNDTPSFEKENVNNAFKEMLSSDLVSLLKSDGTPSPSESSSTSHLSDETEDSSLQTSCDDTELLLYCTETFESIISTSPDKENGNIAHPLVNIQVSNNEMESEDDGWSSSDDELIEEEANVFISKREKRKRMFRNYDCFYELLNENEPIPTHQQTHIQPNHLPEDLNHFNLSHSDVIYC